MKKVILITGISSGFGKETAGLLAELRPYRLWYHTQKLRDKQQDKCYQIGSDRFSVNKKSC